VPAHGAPDPALAGQRKTPQAQDHHERPRGNFVSLLFSLCFFLGMQKIHEVNLTQQDLINSELGGIAVGNNDQCFRLVDLKRMFNNTIHMEMESGVPFFITIDPCAGGEHSDFAMVSFVVSHGVYQVLGAEALQTKVSLILILVFGPLVARL
jgi:hypothetical protein